MFFLFSFAFVFEFVSNLSHLIMFGRYDVPTVKDQQYMRRSLDQSLEIHGPETKLPKQWKRLLGTDA